MTIKDCLKMSLLRITNIEDYLIKILLVPKPLSILLIVKVTCRDGLFKLKSSVLSCSIDDYRT